MELVSTTSRPVARCEAEARRCSECELPGIPNGTNRPCRSMTSVLRSTTRGASGQDHGQCAERGECNGGRCCRRRHCRVHRGQLMVSDQAGRRGSVRLGSAFLLESPVLGLNCCSSFRTPENGTNPQHIGREWCHIELRFKNPAITSPWVCKGTHRSERPRREVALGCDETEHSFSCAEPLRPVLASL